MQRRARTSGTVAAPLRRRCLAGRPRGRRLGSPARPRGQAPTSPTGSRWPPWSATRTGRGCRRGSTRTSPVPVADAEPAPPARCGRLPLRAVPTMRTAASRARRSPPISRSRAGTLRRRGARGRRLRRHAAASGAAMDTPAAADGLPSGRSGRRRGGRDHGGRPGAERFRRRPEARRKRAQVPPPQPTAFRPGARRLSRIEQSRSGGARSAAATRRRLER